MRSRMWLVVLVASLWLSAAPADAKEVGQARPWIGVEIEDGTRGVRIRGVREKTPAQAAGLQLGDEVASLDGKPLKKAGDLIAAVQERGVGAKVVLQVWRGDKSVPVTLALAARPDEAEMLRQHLVGKPAPAFVAAEKVQGPHAATLAELKGQVVVLEFWATWCGPCRTTLPVLAAWQTHYGARGLRVIGLSGEKRDKLQAFLAKEPVPYTIAVDGDGATQAAYGVPAIPTLVILDRAGVVRFAEVGAGETLAAAETVVLKLLAEGEPVKAKATGGKAKPAGKPAAGGKPAAAP